MASAAIVALALLGRGRPAQAGCGDDPFVAELLATGDAFRAVTLLKRAEFDARGSAEGFVCARTLFRLYLEHQEHAVADAWLTRLLAHYGAAAAIAPPSRLRAELAWRFGSAAEARARLGPAFAAGDPLSDFIAAAEAPAAATPTCAGQACDGLRALLAEPLARARKSPPLALALSLVPGAGQVYAGRTIAGFGSFVLNTAVTGLSLWAFSRGERALGATAATLGAGLYFGNLYAGFEAARRENDRRDAALAARLRSAAVTPGIDALAKP